MLGRHEEDPLLLFGGLYEKMKRRLGQRHLEQGDDGPRIGDGQVVRGTITWGGEIGHPALVIDGRRMTWREFGELVAPFEGFQFRLEIRDRTEEIE